jgi:D-glycero-alpha-D-manno-heptose-7-phosphate kinase
MIISKTPFRISFAGGGSDIAGYYRKNGGAVVSTTIDKYVYLSMHPYFAERKIFLKYSSNELVDSIDHIHHPIIREVFRYYDINGVDFNSSADIPSGTGLGSSSAFTVGLIQLCNAYLGKFISKEEIAQLACSIEIDKLNEPIGKQDQYACAYGGLNYIQFNPDENVVIEKIHLQEEKLKQLQERLLMFYLGRSRSANIILKDQSENLSGSKQKENLKRMVQLASTLKKELNNGNIDNMGKVMHEGWMYKKELSSKISDDFIDKQYSKAMKAGATGGKLLGAGGGGFLLFYVPDHKQNAVRKSMADLYELDFNFDNSGSAIIF